MRIISGSARGRKLGNFSDSGIRPTPDRVREAVFSMLLSRRETFSGTKVLDIFAGTGAMALEALSRGAEHATLIDQDRQAERLILENLTSCALAEKAHVVRRPVTSALKDLAGRSCFDLVFLDPPYSRGLIAPTLELLIQGHLLKNDGIVIAESDKKDKQSTPPEGLERTENRIFGRTRIEFFQLPDRS